MTHLLVGTGEPMLTDGAIFRFNGEDKVSLAIFAVFHWMSFYAGDAPHNSISHSHLFW